MSSALYSVPLQVPVFMPLTYYFDYYSFVMELEIRKCDASIFVLLSQDCFDYSESFVVPNTFYNSFSISVKNAIGIQIRITLNLQIALGNMDIFTILILPIQEHGVSFHLFICVFFIPSICVIVFSVQVFHFLGQIYS